MTFYRIARKLEHMKNFTACRDMHPYSRRSRAIGRASLAAAFLFSAGTAFAAAPQASQPHLEAALENITALSRPGQDGYATVWDGNKYIQCKRLPDHTLRCEAAGALLQPSLAPELTSAHVARLTALGWHLDASFGNYVQIFPADAALSVVANTLMQTLGEAYDANLAALEVESIWVAHQRCPPRNGPSQNLAGVVNDAPAMAATAIRTCTYKPEADTGPSLPAASAADLIRAYGARVTAEIQRLRVNAQRRVFAIFDAGIGYVQCEPNSAPPAIYCEAQSAYSWEALASVLTPERIARLHGLGFADPGRAPNYWKSYPMDRVDDATVAHDVLTVLHDVYGYDGQPSLAITTEERRR